MADLFGDRMKGYEAVSDIKLTKRIPLIIRLDGNSFSKFTKKLKFQKPFDENFYDAMCHTMVNLLKYCGGAQLGYTQSDEITILLRNDMTVDTEAFLANRLEKICSLLGGLASVSFSNFINRKIDQGETVSAIFDCRVFIVPDKEVNNAFLWRQKDAFKNCCSGVTYHGLKNKHGRKTAQRMMHKVSNKGQQELMFSELGININDYPSKYRRGVCAIRKEVNTPIEELIPISKVKALGKEGEVVNRKVWEIDEDIPLFNQDVNYIEKFLI